MAPTRRRIDALVLRVRPGGECIIESDGGVTCEGQNFGCFSHVVTGSHRSSSSDLLS